MSSHPSEHGSPRPIKEEVESHASTLAPSKERRIRAVSSMGAAGRAQQAFLEQMIQLLYQVTGAIPQA